MNRSIRGLVWVVVYAIAGWRGVLSGVEVPPPDPYQAPFEKMSGSELALLLPDATARSRAFYELFRRMIAAEPEENALFCPDQGYEIFARSFPAPRVTICPQANGAKPRYLVSYNGMFRPLPGDLGTLTIFGDALFEVERRHELFPPLAAYKQPVIDRKNPGFQVFDAEGKPVNTGPLINVLEANVADLNGDGVLECAFSEKYGIGKSDPGHICVLQVVTLEAHPKILLSLVINWAADDWTFRVRDANGDGVSDIELGPRTVNGIRPRVVFRWDRKAGAFRGPSPGRQDHFRVLKNDMDLAPELSRLAAAGLSFPREASAVPEHYEPPVKRRGKKAGENADRQMFPNRLPAVFWSLDPKVATLAFAEANRNQDHRTRFRLALDDRDGATPPARGSVALKDGRRGCTGESGSEWFLHYAPDNSYLLSVKWTGRLTLKENRYFAPSFAKYKLSYADARQIGAVIWWLDRLRTHPQETPTPVFIADNERILTMRGADGEVLSRRAEYCTYPQWEGNYTKRVHLDAVAWLVSEVLPKKADEAAAKLKGRADVQPHDDIDVKEMAGWILELWTPEETRVSHIMAAVAARAAPADQARVTARLRTIAERIPRPDPPEGRSFWEIVPELQTVVTAFAHAPRSYQPGWEAKEAGELTRLREKHRALLLEAAPARIRDVNKEGLELLSATIKAVLGVPAVGGVPPEASKESE